MTTKQEIALSQTEETCATDVGKQAIYQENARKILSVVYVRNPDIRRVQVDAGYSKKP